MADALAVPTSIRLREQNLDEWDRALEHPLIQATATGSVDQAVFERWVVLNTQFLRTYRRFFIVMGTLAPDTRSSTVMVQGLRSTDLEIEDAEQYGEKRGLDLSVEPSPPSMDYTSFVMATAAQGWSRGLVAVYGIESVYYDAWLSVRQRVTSKHPYWRFIDLWSNEYQRRYVHDLSVLVDDVEPTTELERIFRSVARLERCSWSEAFGDS